MRFTAIDLTASFRDSDLVTEQLSSALRHSVVVHVLNRSHVEQPLKYWEDVVSRLGEPVYEGEDSHTGVTHPQDSIWSDVRFDPHVSASFRHQNSAQPLHTDGAYLADAPDLVLFYCARQAASGGATLFLDVIDLVAGLTREYPDLYRALTTVPVEFRKATNKGKTSPILSFDEQGARINWNYYRVAPDQPEEVLMLREALHEVLTTRFMHGKETLPIRLRPGEAVIFNDVRTLHGREAYSACQSGDRLLWKCYIAPAKQGAAS